MSKYLLDDSESMFIGSVTECLLGDSVIVYWETVSQYLFGDRESMF